MQNDQWDEVIYTAVSECVESMAFMELLPAAPEAALPENPAWVSQLVLDPTQGEFRLALSRALLAEIAANMFGPETEVTEQQTADVLAELLNTIVGRFMGEILPIEPFRLGIPVQGSGELPPVNPDEAIQWHFVAEDEYPLTVIASGAPLLQLCQP